MEILGVLFLVALALALARVDSTSPTHTPTPTIDSRLEAEDAAIANILITMREGTDQVLARISAANTAGSFRTRASKGSALTSALQAHAAESQASVLKVLGTTLRQVDLTSFWITNQIYVRNAPLPGILDLLRDRDDVASVDQEDLIHMDRGPSRTETKSRPHPREEGEVAYNLKQMGVPDLWNLGINGTGVTIGSIDTGVHYTHEGLYTNYKNDNHSWLDALTDSRYQVPTDDHGTGTLFLGPAVGGLGIGVAPGSQWISCRAFDENNTASEASVLSCTQFILAPTRPDGSQGDAAQAPHVVTIGWSPPSKTKYDVAFMTWRAAGIIPVFAALGSPGCSSLLYPAWLDLLSVGATDEKGGLARFSGIGPGPALPDSGIKPDLVAPGLGIISTAIGIGSDSSYEVIPEEKAAAASGAQVAGVIALLLQADPTLSYEEIRQVIQATAFRNLQGLDGGASDVCGGLPASKFPNFHFGYGRVNALAAYECVIDGLSCLPHRGPMALWVIGLIDAGAVLLALLVMIALIVWRKRVKRGRDPKRKVTDVNSGVTVAAGGSDSDFLSPARRVGSTRHRDSEGLLVELMYRFHNGVLSVSWCQVDPDVTLLDAPQNTDIASPTAPGALTPLHIGGNYTAVTTPYDRAQFELPRWAVEIDEGSVLGCGQFGVVFQGRLLVTQHTHTLGRAGTRVAIKMLKRSKARNANAATSLLKELQILIHIGTHANVVRLLGACTRSDHADEILIALDICVNGNLQKYLRACRRLLGTRVRESEGEVPNGSRLREWATQIATGMEFLVQKRVVHGDLAARNVLLDGNLTAKISDFGLAARLCEYTKYVKAEQLLLPWRWMAIESLRDMRFSHASDVWSFGITVWEIFSLGGVPYEASVPGWSGDFVHHLVSGLRNERPVYGSDGLYNILTRCWHSDPDQRPTMGELKEMLSCADIDATELRSTPPI